MILFHSDFRLDLYGFVESMIHPPCFAIPVFSNGKNLYVQEIDEMNITKGFIPLDDDHNIITFAESHDKHALVGHYSLNAFILSDSEILIAHSEEMKQLLLKFKNYWASYAFVSLDVWEFIGNEQESDTTCLKIADAIGAKNINFGGAWLIQNRPELFQKWYSGDVESMIRADEHRATKRSHFRL